MRCSVCTLMRHEAALGVVLYAQLVELLQDVLRALVAPDDAVPVEEHHVACAHTRRFLEICCTAATASCPIMSPYTFVLVSACSVSTHLACHLQVFMSMHACASGQSSAGGCAARCRRGCAHRRTSWRSA